MTINPCSTALQPYSLLNLYRYETRDLIGLFVRYSGVPNAKNSPNQKPREIVSTSTPEGTSMARTHGSFKA